MKSLASIIDGDDRSWRGRLIRVFLWPLSLVYGIATSIRNGMFDRGWRRSHTANVPILSIGNLTAGGTGKTPHVIWFARYFRQQGFRIAILSRGYGTLENGENDEARELALRLPDVPNLIDPDRVRSAQIAADELEMQLGILDDGFQHRRLRRDLDVVLLDVTNPFGYGHLLPRGLLRESLRGLRRADVLILTRCELASESDLSKLKEELRRWTPQTLIAQSRMVPSRWVQANGVSRVITEGAGRRALLVCAIGNPKAFRQTVINQSILVVGERVFPDHHDFQGAELETLELVCQEVQADLIVCTVKDLVKINRNRIGTIPVWALEIEVEMINGLKPLTQALHELTHLVTFEEG